MSWLLRLAGDKSSYRLARFANPSLEVIWLTVMPCGLLWTVEK
jgi:hypothetical protein